MEIRWQRASPGEIHAKAQRLLMRIFADLMKQRSQLIAARCLGLLAGEETLAFCLAEALNSASAPYPPITPERLPYRNGSGPPTAAEFPPDTKGEKFILITHRLTPGLVEWLDKLIISMTQAGGKVLGVGAIDSEVSKDELKQLGIPVWIVEE